jgi:hypothetical protein
MPFIDNYNNISYQHRRPNHRGLVLALALFGVVVGAGAYSQANYDNKSKQSVENAKATEKNLKQSLRNGEPVSVVPGTVVIDKGVRTRGLPTRFSGASVGTVRLQEQLIIERPMVVESKDTTNFASKNDQPKRYLAGFALSQYGVEQGITYIGIAESTIGKISVYPDSDTTADVSICPDNEFGTELVRTESDGNSVALTQGTAQSIGEIISSTDAVAQLYGTPNPICTR